MNRSYDRDALGPRVLLLALALVVALSGVLAAPDEDETEAQTPKQTLEGRVLDPEGNPVAGATVLALSEEARPKQRPGGLIPGPRFDRKEHAVAEITTGDDGAFRIEVEGPAPFMLRAQHDGFATVGVNAVAPGDPTTIRLQPGWTVRGRVLHKTTGKPVVRAKVTARATVTDGFGTEENRERFLRETESGEDGGFTFDNLEANYYRIVAVAEGYAEAVVSRLEVGLQDGGPQDVFLYLTPGVTFAGSVVDAEGSPIEGARVGVRPEQTIPGELRRWAQSGGFTAKTEEDGKFEIHGVLPAPSYAVEASHDDHAPAALTGLRVREGTRSDPLRITLARGTTLTARLVADGRPYEGEVSVSLVYALRETKFKPQVSRTLKPEEVKQGRLSAERLPAGQASLTIRTEGYANVSRQQITLKADAPLDLGELVLESGLSIAGSVRNADGEPVAEASVQAMSFASGGMQTESAKTRADGSFRIAGLQDVAYTVRAEGEGYGRTSVKDVKPGGEDLKLLVERAGRIRGRILAGGTAEPRPVGGFTVELQPVKSDLPPQLQMVGMGKSRLDFRDRNGEFTIDGLAGGGYKLKIEASGFVPTRLDDITVDTAETSDLGEIVLERGATLRGTVRERESGRPVGGASVETEEPGMFNMRGFMEMGVAERTTGPDGSFTLSGLTPGRHSIKVVHDDFAPRKEEVEIAAGVPPADLTVELGKGGAIEGTFRDKQGELVPNGMVIIMQGFMPDPSGIISTDEYGHFRKDHLTPGSYRVMAMTAPDAGSQDQAAMLASMQMQSVEVVDGETSVIVIPPQSGGVTVNGTVRRGAQRVEARLFWMRMASDGTTPEDFTVAVSDASGAYQVRLNAPGEYRVAIQATGDEQNEMGAPGMTLKVEIPADQEQVLQDLVISEVAVSGAVVDAATALPIKGAFVGAFEYREDRELRESIMASSDQTDDQGRYELEGLGEERYWLVFSKQGYAAQVDGPLDLEGSGDEGSSAALEPTSRGVTVQVQDPTGNPVEGAFVTALDFPPFVIAGTSGETDMDGQIVLDGLSDGTHDLGVVGGGHAPTVRPQVLFPSEGGEPVLIEVQRGARVKIRAIDGQQQPVAQATVRVRREDGTDLTALMQFTAMMRGRGLITGPDGTLVISSLESGRYVIELNWQGLRVEERVRIEADKENVLEIELKDQL